MGRSTRNERALRFLRRDLLGGAAVAASGVGALASSMKSPAGQTATPPPIRNDKDLEQALPTLSNWRRWGTDDQLGTLNFISPKTRLAAAALIRTGRVVPLGREISTTTPELRNFSYKMSRYEDALPEEAGCIDTIGMTCHGFAVTHVDALCHLFTPEGRQGMYNGYPIDDVTPSGALRLGIEHVGAVGIVGRGVLLDVAEVKGGPLPLGSAIMPEDLEAAEQLHDLRVGEGDVVFVRNGAGQRNTYKRGTGLHAACLPWLRDRRVAVLSNDSDGDAHPPIPGFERWTEPIHM
ncbi:MAG TPA: cyclase family protein, partial [Acetobacteraceae bacterium]|nr:cyclase family protein [Acetobacteraceae bacterium]